MPKIILLDVDNTLLDFHRCAAASMTEACARFDVACTADMVAAFMSINAGLWARHERGEISREQILVHRWRQVFATLGLNLDAAAFERLFLKNLATAAIPMDGAAAMLRALHPAYTLCAASNAPQQQQEQRLTKAGFRPLLAAVFTSETIGAAKPATAFFDGCLAQLGNPDRRQVLMIGDSLSADMRGALDSGIATCWFNPHGVPRPDWPIDFEVASLADIPAVLKTGWRS